MDLLELKHKLNQIPDEELDGQPILLDKDVEYFDWIEDEPIKHPGEDFDTLDELTKVYDPEADGWVWVLHG